MTTPTPEEIWETATAALNHFRDQYAKAQRDYSAKHGIEDAEQLRSIFADWEARESELLDQLKRAEEALRADDEGADDEDSYDKDEGLPPMPAGANIVDVTGGSADEEEGFLWSIVEEPTNAATTWPVYADWLEDHDDPRVELVRLCHDPSYSPALLGRQRDGRIRALLAEGVMPCVPQLTNSIGMLLAHIPAGKFQMGSPEDEKNREADEGPQHEVVITESFFLGVYPITQEQYQTVMGENSSHFTDRSGLEYMASLRRIYPVEQVSWEEAVEFCRRLSVRAEETSARRTYRLPTEAEWEYACRAGAACSTSFFFGDSLSSTQANFNGDYPYGDAGLGPNLQRPSVVGSYQPNAFGLYDMHGNVWEWCRDWYDENYYSQSPAQDPKGPEQGAFRVLRGGSWFNPGADCRSAVRGEGEPGNRNHYIGFRVVCVAPSTS
jgi:uncharacterized protein (TIGR02996 family)